MEPKKVKFINEWEKYNRTFSGESWKDVVKGIPSVVIEEETNNILLETGDALLLETGDNLIKE